MTVVEVQREKQEQVEDQKESYEDVPNADLVPIRVANISTRRVFQDTLHSKSTGPICKVTNCLTDHKQNNLQNPDVYTIVKEAKLFWDEYFKSIGRQNTIEHMQREQDSIWRISSEEKEFELTQDELIFGARLAWRNQPSSINRFDWKNLLVLDCTHVETAVDIFRILCQHIALSTNNGAIRPTMTVFPQHHEGKEDFRIWNRQLIAYAGYQQEDGTILGDAANVKFTQLCQKLGWEGSNTTFDILPLVINTPENDPEWFPIPEELILTVKLQHPSYPWFENLGLQWNAMYSECNHLLNIAGMKFPAVSLSHSHISSDVASYLLEHCLPYNLMQTIGDNLSLDTSIPNTLWKEKVVVELNEAILYSYENAATSILDHHSASDKFVRFFNVEQNQRGGCPGDWNKIVPVLSSGITLAFHQEMILYKLTPNFEEQPEAMKVHKWIDSSKDPRARRQNKITFKTVAILMKWLVQHLKGRTRATIIYASETGRSESFADSLATLFGRAFSTNVVCMKDYNIQELGKNEQLFVVVTSTFGNGGAPENGKKFSSQLKKCLPSTDKNNNDTKQKFVMDLRRISKLKFAVFGLGSTAYPDFCKFGHFCHDTLTALGAKQILPIEMADELRGQDRTFEKWAPTVFKAACSEFNISIGDQQLPEMFSSPVWDSNQYRLLPLPESTNGENIYSALSKIHNRAVHPCFLTYRENLLPANSKQQTILVHLKCKHANHEPGDHAAICPANRGALVGALINRLGLGSKKHTVIQPQKFNGANWVPVNRFPLCTWNTAFTNFLDISTTPQQQFLKLLSRFATNESETQQLLLLADDDEVYDNWRLGCQTLLNILNEFPSVKPDPIFLLLNLPILQPRFYSISNSVSLVPQEIHLTVGVLTYQNNAGKDRFGICSNYLNDLPVGVPLPCFIRKAPEFKLPKEKQVPVMMVGAGTGIAPYRSFWQQRQFELIKANPEDVGKMSLYFGCRQPETDHLFSYEMDSLVANSLLSSLRVAYSRSHPFRKVYVQNLLKQDELSVWNHLNEGGHVYICGDATMAADVTTTLRKIIQRHGQMMEEDAQEFLDSMKERDMLHEDIFASLKPRSARKPDRS